MVKKLVNVGLNMVLLPGGGDPRGVRASGRDVRGREGGGDHAARGGGARGVGRAVGGLRGADHQAGGRRPPLPVPQPGAHAHALDGRRRTPDEHRGEAAVSKTTGY